MKFAKKIEIKLAVKDNPFLKEQVPYLQRCCNFLPTDGKNHVLYNEPTELVALIDSDEFIITLEPVTHRNGELTIDGGEFQYTVRLTFNGTSMTGHLYGSYEPYVLLTQLELFRLVFPNVKFSTEESLYPISIDVDDYITTKSSSFYPISLDVDDYINPILSMVFGLKNEGNFKYEII